MKSIPARMFSVSLALLSAAHLNTSARAQAERQAAAPAWGTAVEGLQFRAVPAKAEFAVDEPVIVNLELKTTETQYIPLEENKRPVKEFKITLTDSRGAAVPLTRFGRLVAAEPIFGPYDAYANPVVGVHPGRKMIFHFWINRMYDMTTPGNYLITFSRSGVVKAAVVSNTAVIKVVESTRFNSPETSLDLPSSQPL